VSKATRFTHLASGDPDEVVVRVLDTLGGEYPVVERQQPQRSDRRV